MHHAVQVEKEKNASLQEHTLQTAHSIKTGASQVGIEKGPHVAEDQPGFKSDIERANIISKLDFWYVFKIIKKALKIRHDDRGLKDQDLVSFPYSRRSEVLEKKFTADMERQKRKHPSKKPSLTLAIIRSTKWDIIICLIVAIVFSFVRIFTAWVLKRLIDAYPISNSEAYKWSGALAGCLVVGLFLEHHYNHIGTYFPTHIRGGLVSMIYNKVIQFSTYTMTKVSPGQIINLASNDVNVFDEFGVYFPKLVVAPIVIVASGALLWIYFGVVCLVGLGYICMWFPLQTLYIVKEEKSTLQKNETSDERVKLTRESIEGIRLLKMYTWELRFKSSIFDFRNKEISLLRKEVLGESVWRGLSFSSLAVASFLIFMPHFQTGGVLTAGEVFSTFYLFSFLRLYGSFFVNQGLVFLVQARQVIKRTEKILEVPGMGDIKFEPPTNKENAIEFDNFTGFWSKTKAEEEEAIKININGAKNDTEEPPIYPAVTNITMNIKKGSLNALVGPVGSGKTSLLLALTGEMPKMLGSLKYTGSFAYVEQEPTIFAGTFRESICFGKQFDPDFYARVIKACNLETDLSLFPNGDLSEIGEKGNNLSGGQKARLALARGVYSDSDIYLLDDPLSAVDPKVAASIFNNCISGILKGKTIILVTHQVDFARSCDNIIVMDQGAVTGTGPFEKIEEHELDIQKVASQIEKGSSYELKKPPKRKESAVLRLHKTLRRHASDHQATINEITTAAPVEYQPKTLVEEPKEIDLYPGKVSKKTYFELAKGMGSYFYLFLLFASFVAAEMSIIAYGRMLGAWITNEFPDWKNQAILGGLCGFAIFIFVFKYILLNVGLVRTTKKHHELMLNRVVQAPVYFFDSNPIGQILNRFSNDIGTLDRFLSLITMDVFDNFFFIFAVIIAISILDPVHLAPLAAEIMFICAAIKICYEGVKQTKQYDLATKGPLFSLFSSSLSGIVVIRGFSQMDSFKEKFKNQLHTSVKGSIGFALTTRFLAFYSDFGYNIAEIIVIFLITVRNNTDNSQYKNAFSLALLLSVSGILQYTLRQFCMGNILAESAARVQSYWEVPNEAPLFLDYDNELKEKGWPQKGDIEFNQVYMRYSPTGPHVIKNLSLHAEAGQRIGCVGRTGAGKTSILQLLFRLQEVDNEFENAGYIKIDNIDTKTMGLHQLRNNISIIPQTPFILTGTVRYNVDPLGKASDEEIWQALKDVRLKKHVEMLPYKLDTQMTAATSVFSVGQKQLICLARSILHPSPIMIMDEATANMDQETDGFVTNKIREKFSSSTTFTIAHRLATIANYDRVLVLDKGQIKEFDEPYKLLTKNIGDNFITNKDGHFASMVMNTGPVTSKHIFEITKNAYAERHPEVQFAVKDGRQEKEDSIMEDQEEEGNLGEVAPETKDDYHRHSIR